ncbi:MAG TPA: zinc metalloprotease HtpX [Thermoanaerobaculia bacterium]|nr:zinc metalloprotease HtpX [Thermoanaerobaculia bacterium]
MNTLKIVLLMTFLTVLLVAVGQATFGSQGAVVALAIAAVMNVFTYFFSDRMVLASYGARLVTEEEAPELTGVVRSLAAKAGLPMPRVAIIPQEAPNAFATGRDPEHAVVAATEGILRILDRDELEAVLSHELGHVTNRDILLGAIAATLAGALTSLAQMAMWTGGGRRSDREGGGSGLVGILAILFAPVAAAIVQAMISRQAEFRADASGAALSGHPLALASALRKLEAATQRLPMDGSPATAHLFIVNPFAGGLARLFSTHPPTEERVARLEAMARGGMTPR